jgi:hypothetical protein
MDWIWERRVASLMKKPQPESGAGAFGSRDGDSTRHLRYEPSRLLVLRACLGREADAG